MRGKNKLTPVLRFFLIAWTDHAPLRLAALLPH